MTVTPANRFAAFNWLLANEANRTSRIWNVVNKATYAESFPNGYTDEVVTASVALLALFPIETLDSVEFVRAAATLNNALLAGRNGEGLR